MCQGVFGSTCTGLVKLSLSCNECLSLLSLCNESTCLMCIHQSYFTYMYNTELIRIQNNDYYQQKVNYSYNAFPRIALTCTCKHFNPRTFKGGGGVKWTPHRFFGPKIRSFKNEAFSTCSLIMSAYFDVNCMVSSLIIYA